MKTLILLFTLILISLSSFAQKESYYQNKYEYSGKPYGVSFSLSSIPDLGQQ